MCGGETSSEGKLVTGGGFFWRRYSKTLPSIPLALHLSLTHTHTLPILPQGSLCSMLRFSNEDPTSMDDVDLHLRQLRVSLFVFLLCGGYE